MIEFNFATPGRIVFGAGRLQELPAIVAGFGVRPLVCVGSNPDRFGPIAVQLPGATYFTVTAEPTLDVVRDGAALARAHQADVVIGLGGGAVLDAAKIIAALAVNPGDILDYVEVIGAGRSLSQTPLPFIAVPTTAGTGSEVTANGVVGSPEHGVKVSLRSPAMIARVALIDPALAVGCPPAVTASSGLDALTQCLEPFVTPFATPLTDALCAEGLRRAASGLRRAYLNGDDLDARGDMAMAALCSGMALANAKLGAVHGFAGALGGMIGAPHGAICAALLAPVCAANIAAITRDDPTSPILARFAEAGRLLTGTASTEALVEWIVETVRLLGVPGLSTLGLPAQRHDEACEKAAAASSMKGNPVTFSHPELLAILEAAG